MPTYKIEYGLTHMVDFIEAADRVEAMKIARDRAQESVFYGAEDLPSQPDVECDRCWGRGWQGSHNLEPSKCTKCHGTGHVPSATQ